MPPITLVDNDRMSMGGSNKDKKAEQHGGHFREPEPPPATGHISLPLPDSGTTSRSSARQSKRAVAPQWVIQTDSEKYVNASPP